MQGKYPDLLGSLTPAIVKADLGANGIFYRVQGGPFDERAAAEELCGKLQPARPAVPRRAALNLRPRPAWRCFAAIFGCAGRSSEPTSAASFARPTRSASSCSSAIARRRTRCAASIAALRDAVGRADAPVLIDQEGGRVAAPEAAALARGAAGRGGSASSAIATPRGARGGPAQRPADRPRARRRSASTSIARRCSICASPGAHDVIGDRAFAADPDTGGRARARRLRGAPGGRRAAGHQAHPGHGRALVDSHHGLPRSRRAAPSCERSDFVPFRALADMPWAMTAHILYTAIDPDRPATLSPAVIADIIRGEIGFDGLLRQRRPLDEGARRQARRARQARARRRLRPRAPLQRRARRDGARSPRRDRRRWRRPRPSALRPRPARDGASSGRRPIAAAARARSTCCSQRPEPAMFDDCRRCSATSRSGSCRCSSPITLHEAAHGFVAWRSATTRPSGWAAVTPNPLRHIDPFGTIILPGCCCCSHAPFLFGYAKPVPVNFRRLQAIRAAT